VADVVRRVPGVDQVGVDVGLRDVEVGGHAAGDGDAGPRERGELVALEEDAVGHQLVGAVEAGAPGVGAGLDHVRVVVDRAVVLLEVDGEAGLLGVDEAQVHLRQLLVVAIVAVLGLLDHLRPGGDARHVVAQVAPAARPGDPVPVELAHLLGADGADHLARALRVHGLGEARDARDVLLLAEVVDVAED